VSVPRTEPAAAAAGAPILETRLGVIDYLNVRPVYDWILRREAAGDPLPGVRTLMGVPSEMNRALATGEIDCSNVSSFAFGEHANEWVLLPGLSVAAHGRVESVLLVSRHADWRALDGRSIAATSHSATSIELVRVLCEQRHGVRPRFEAMAPDLPSMLRAHDAAVIIGDPALVEYHRRGTAEPGQPYVFDLAAEWDAWTGLPFVFAVWAARRDRLDAVRASGVLELLHASRRRGLDGLEAIAAEQAPRLGLAPSTCLDYLRLLDYQLTAQDLLGLRTFLELALPSFAWNRVRMLEECGV
jgi:chorismate dehydratase